MKTEQNRSSAGTLLKNEAKAELSEPRSGEREVRVFLEFHSNLFVTVHTLRQFFRICGRMATATYGIERRIAQIVIHGEFLVEH